MDRPGRAVEGVARGHPDGPPVRAVADLQVHLAGLDEEGLVLALVVLARQLLPRGDVEDLAHVPGRLGPDELVARGLLHTPHRSFLCRHRPAVKVTGGCAIIAPRGLRGSLPARSVMLTDSSAGEPAEKHKIEGGIDHERTRHSEAVPVGT